MPDEVIPSRESLTSTGVGEQWKEAEGKKNGTILYSLD